MSKISIQRAHHLPHDQARAAAEQAVAGLARKYGIQSRWSGDTLHIDGGGVNGTLEVAPQQLSLNLTLGIMAAMFKSVIVDSIEEKLNDVLGR
jgi:putative polyhydroxyalkanoate system protein